MSMQTTKWVTEGEKITCVKCGRTTVETRGFCAGCQTPLELSRLVGDRDREGQQVDEGRVASVEAHLLADPAAAGRRLTSQLRGTIPRELHAR